MNPYKSTTHDFTSYEDICREMSRQLKSGYLNWPQYVGKLGEDSTGGTNGSIYSDLCAKGYLTIDSQDGYCDPEEKINLPLEQNIPLFANEALQRYPSIVSGGIERQYSYVDFLTPVSRKLRIKSLIQQHKLPLDLLDHHDNPNETTWLQSISYKQADGSVLITPYLSYHADRYNEIEPIIIDSLLEWCDYNPYLVADFQKRNMCLFKVICKHICVASAAEILLSVL